MHIEIIRRRRCLRSALNRSSGRAGRESAFSRFARIKNHREQNALRGDKNSQIVLVSRPHGEPTPANFKLVEAPMPTIGEGQILLKTKYLSLDPYMRGRMSDARSYVPPFAIGDPLGGGTVSEVVASNNSKFYVGDILLAFSGWQEYSVSDGNGLRKLDPNMAPVSTALGVLGMPGLTAYGGLLNIGQPKEGETLVVAAAAGPVGSAVGQIGKIKGCRVVGIAGGPKKVDYLVKELGFDAAVDHRSEHMKEELKAACPNGIDIYFENVGGAVWDAVLPLLNNFARVPVCGMVANYNNTSPPEGPDRSAALMRAILVKRLRIQGFIVTDYAKQTPEFIRDVSTWIREGKLKYREDILDGLERAPEAFIGLLNGANFGKLLVKVSN
jgi:NADPH-dependent curcumin reductase CurA